MKVYLITRLHIYPNPDLLIEILFVLSSGRGLLVPGPPHGTAKPLDSGPLVLFGGQAPF